MIVWIKNDAEAIRKNMKDYEAKVKAMIEEEEKKPRLDVASAADLQRLERMSGKKSGGGLIIP